MDYTKAIAIAVKAANYAANGIKFIVEHPKDVKDSLLMLTQVLDAAKKLMDTAVDVVPIDNLINQATADESAQAEPTESQNDAPDDKKQPLRPPAFLVKAKDSVVNLADEQRLNLERRKLEQEMLKAVHDSRRKVLESATITFSMRQLADQLGAKNEGGAIAGLGVLDLPGCFAIARYGKVDLRKDPTAFTGIYVGKDACVGDGIARTIAPTGNADVYADIKYKQNVMVYVFTCSAEALDEKHEALVQLFAAGESYNRVEMGVSDEEYVEAE